MKIEWKYIIKWFLINSVLFLLAHFLIGYLFQLENDSATELTIKCVVFGLIMSFLFDRRKKRETAAKDTEK